MTAANRRTVLLGAAASLVAPGAIRFAGAETTPTLLLSHPDFARHDPGAGHVERPERMRAIDRALASSKFNALRRRRASLRGDAEAAILRAHSAAHLARIAAVAKDRGHLPHAFDGDTVMSDGTWTAALLGVSAGLDAVDAVLEGSEGIRNAFCQLRPPGHHAEAGRVMGFCFFSNVAIAALYARARHGLERVAVVDFDVHHGNGTQRIFWSDKDLFFGSTHEMPLFPGTGAVSETGVGNIFNAPLRAGDGGTAFREAMQTRILPALEAFGPDLILVSAGFDAHAEDPLGHIQLREDDFAWITEQLMACAEKTCRGRIVSMLEGGYSLPALGRSVAAHIETLLGA